MFSQRLAIRLLSKGTVPVKINKVKQAKIIKCSESMWKLTYYSTVQVCVLTITYREPWLWDTKEYFRGWPNQELKWVQYFLGAFSVGAYTWIFAMSCNSSIAKGCGYYLQYMYLLTRSIYWLITLKFFWYYHLQPFPFQAPQRYPYIKFVSRDTFMHTYLVDRDTDIHQQFG